MLTPMQPVPRIPGYNVAARQDHDRSAPPGPATAGQTPVRGAERVADPPRTDTATGRQVDTGPTQKPSERVRRTSDPRTWACRSRYQGDRTRWCGGCRAHRKCTTRRNVTPDQPPDSPESPESLAPPAPPVLTPLGPPSRVSPSRSSPPTLTPVTPTPASDLTTTATPEPPLLSPNLTDLPRRTHRRQSATRAPATPEPPPLTPQGTPSRLRRSPATSDGEEPPQPTPHHHQAGLPPSTPLQPRAGARGRRGRRPQTAPATPAAPTAPAGRTSRDKANQGGVLLLTRDDVPYTMTPSPYQPTNPDPNTYYVATKIHVHGMTDITIVNIYIPPARRTPGQGTQQQTIQLDCLRTTGSTIIGGDVNAHNISWDIYQPEDPESHAIEAWAIERGLTIANSGQHTRVNPSTVGRSAPDLTLVSIELASGVEWETGSGLGSDHLPIYVTLPTIKQRPKRRGPGQFRQKKADWEAFLRHLDAEIDKWPNQDQHLAISKLAERLVQNRLQHWLERHRKLNPNQTGFRKGHSTADQLFRVTQSIFDAFEQPKHHRAILVLQPRHTTESGGRASSTKWRRWAPPAAPHGG